MTNCEKYGHYYDTLYPKSVYWCPTCKTQHGTGAVNGAVSWHCPACYVAGRKSDVNAQVYLGRTCSRCGDLDQTKLIDRQRKACLVAWSNGGPKPSWMDAQIAEEKAFVDNYVDC